MGLGRVFRDRYVAVGVGALVVFLSCVAVAFAYSHSTNSVNHGLINDYFNGRPFGFTHPPGHIVTYSTAEVRHYAPDGSYTIQCSDPGWGVRGCHGTWGSLPCQKRYVGGSSGLMDRHWVRLGPSCPGQLHG
jgi:hypothetical protein